MFIWVKDKATGHQYDVDERSFNEEKHQKVARVTPAKRARAAKPNVKTAKAAKTSTKTVVEGVSPASE